MSRSTGNSRIREPRAYSPRRRLCFETLEMRRLLSVDPFSEMDGPAWEISPDSHDGASILVRFEPGYRGIAAVEPVGFGAGILQGTHVGRQLGRVSGLHRIHLSSAVSVEAALAAYRNSSMVTYAEPNFRVRIAETYPEDPRFGEMWALHNTGQTGGRTDADIDAPLAWDITTGSGAAVVAVIDTGVDYMHPDLAGNMWINQDEIPGDGLDNDGNGYVDDVYGYDFINRDGNPMDDQGHGTHVAGTIGAAGNNGTGVTGINWDVQIMALKFLGADGWGDGADAIEAIYYALANGASIINASWGGDPYSQALHDAIAAARDANCIVVAAAGNGNSLGVGLDNDASPYYPASYDLDNLVAVAAVDANDRLAGFSNYGRTSVDLAAPGVNILSTMPGAAYAANSGTSMAAPHAAGVLALVQDLHPEWTYRQVIEQVLTTVDVLPEFYGTNATAGRLNAAAAVGNPQPPSPPLPAGALPIFEAFADPIADYLRPQAGNWNVASGRYHTTPVAENHDLVAISTFDVDAPLPENFEIEATIRADEGRLEFFGWVLKDHLTNGYLVFDYRSPEDFRFAGADIAGNRWVLGRRDAGGWTIDAALSEPLAASTDYRVRLLIENGTDVRLEVNGVGKLTHGYNQAVHTGLVGLGARDSTTHFDDVLVAQYVPDTFGARLVAVGSFDRYSDPVSSLRLIFNESIDAATFTVEDLVGLSGPAGPFAVTGVTEVAGSNGTEFEVAFVTQTELGEYTLLVGPDILDSAGNPMDQDGDGVNGEPVEDRAAAVFHIVTVAERLDFGMPTTPVAAGYTRVLVTDLYSTAAGYGWQESSMTGWDRASGGDLLRDFHYGAQGTFLMDLPNGQYEVVLTMGDASGLHDQMAVFFEEVQANTVTTQGGQYAINSYLVDVNDGQLALKLLDLGGSNANVVINAMEVIVAGADRVAPQVVSVSPASPVVGTFDRIELVFDEPIDPTSFAADDVSLSGPLGPIAPLAVAQLDSQTYEVTFAPQSELGAYQLVVGPGIADPAGNMQGEPFVADWTIKPPPEYLMRLDLGTPSTPVAAGYAGVPASTLYSAATGYGWQESSMFGWDRGTGGDLLRDFHYGTRGTFLIDVPNGWYEVVLTMGDEASLHDRMAVFLEGVQVDTVTTLRGQYAVNTYLVDVSDGQLTLALVDEGGTNGNVVINALEVVVAAMEPAVTTANISLAAAAVPVAENDIASLEQPSVVRGLYPIDLLLNAWAADAKNASVRPARKTSWPIAVLRSHAGGHDRFFSAAADADEDDLLRERQWLNLLAADVSQL